MANSTVTRMIFVRVAEPHLNFVKEDVTADSNSNYVRIQVHGFDELGDPVMPIFEVPSNKEVNNAINNEAIVEFNDKGEKTTKYNGRLIEVDPALVDQFPKWIGHPTQQMSVEQIANTVLSIREEQLKGDVILGQMRKPYIIRKDLFDDVEDFERCKALINAGVKVKVPENPEPVKKQPDFNGE